MAEIIKGIVKHRYGTAANYTSENKVLLAGELAIESDTGRFKFGDGVTSWNSLKYSVTDIIGIVINSTITAIEGRQYIVKNTDSSAHTITYGANVTTLQPDYTGIFYYANSSWVYLGAWNENGDFIAGGNISAIGTIAAATPVPEIYDFYIQEPQAVTPGSKFSGTSWANVSSRSLFYHLAASSGGVETDVVIRDLVEHDNGGGTWSIDKEYAFADLVYDDVIGGSGTHAGKYIIAVDDYSGLYARLEGGLAPTFENGKGDFASQRMLGDTGWHPEPADSYNGVFSLQTLASHGGASSVATGLRFDNSAGGTYKTSGTGSGDGEVATDSYSIKKWRRTS